MKKLIGPIASLCVLASCASTPKITNEVSSTGLNVKKTVLDNGLTVLISPNPKLPIAAYYTYFDVGGRYEGKGTTGATHFLEHMMFKGAKKYGPGVFDTLIERNGGSTNAYTTSDATVYHQTIPSSFVPTMIDLEADRLQNLMLEKNSFESERQVVFEERKMRYENSPDGMLYLLMMKKVFEGTPYGQSVIGDVQDLKDLTRDQMMEFFKTFYTPDNAVVAIVGDVDPEKTLEIVKEKYGSIPRSKDLSAFKKEKDSEERFRFKAKFGTEYNYYSTNPNPKFMYAYKAEKIGTDRALVMDILAYILGNGGSSYLSQKYVQNQNPLLARIDLGNYNLRYSGVFYFSGELLETTDFNKFKTDFFKDVKSFCKEGLDEHALQKAKNQIMSSAYHQMKTNAGLASIIMMNEKLYGDYNYGQKELAKYMKISLSEVKNACNEILNNDQGIFISVWNQNPKNSETK